MLTDQPVTSIEPAWDLDMVAAPTGRKLLALTPGNVAVFAVLTPSNLKYFRAWCPLPKLTIEQKDALNDRN